MEKCDKCGTIKALMNCEIYVTPDDQPYNDVEYEEMKTEMTDDEKQIFGYTVMFCEKCRTFDEIEKSCF